MKMEEKKKRVCEKGRVVSDRDIVKRRREEGRGQMLMVCRIIGALSLVKDS